MADVAALGLKVSSEDLPKATGQLGQFAEAAKKAETANDNLAKSTGRTGDASKKLATAATSAATSTGKAADAAGKADGAFNRMTNSVNGVGGALTRVAVTAAGAFLAAFSVGALGKVADAWSDMQSRVGAAVKDMDAAPALMQRMVDVANASYSPLEQTVEIYARNVSVLRDLGKGATEAADFTEALNHALVITATKGEQAASVQNALSKAMAVGKLRADGLETVLASGGRVAEALAAELKTNVNGLRDMAAQGKITGDVIANALINRLDELREQAGEMPATIGDAFTRIGTNFTALIGIMDQMTGASEMVASALISFADGIRWLSGETEILQRALVYAGTAAVGFGAYYGGAMAIAAASTITLAGALGVLRVALITTGVGAIVVLAGELVYQFMQLVDAAGGLGAAFNFLYVAAVEVFDRIPILFEGVMTKASAFSLSFQASFAEMAAGAIDYIIDLPQKTVEAFNWAVDAIGTMFSNIPPMIADAVVGAVNYVLGKIDEMINTAISGINTLVKALNSIPGVNLGEIGPATVGQITSGLVGSAKAILNFDPGKLADTLRESAGEMRNASDAAHSAGDALIGMATKPLAAMDLLNKKVEETNDTINSGIAGKTGAAASGGGGKSKKSAGGAGKKDPYAELIASSQKFIEQQRLEAETVGMTAEAAARLRYEQDMLNKAANDNIALTAAQRQEIAGLAQQMASAEANTKSLKDAFDFAKDAVGGFITDLRTGLQNGEGFFQSFGKAAMNVLNKILSKIEDELVNALFSMGGAGGGGGILGGLFGGIGKLFGFANGGAFDGGMQRFARGGAFTNSVVNRPTPFRFAKGAGLMGEAGPEAIMPLKRDGKGRLGVYSDAANGNSSVHVTTDVRVSVDENGNMKAFVEKTSQKQVQKAAPAIVNAAKQQAVPAMAEYQSNVAGSEWR